MDRATGFYPVGWGFESLRACTDLKRNTYALKGVTVWSTTCADQPVRLSPSVPTGALRVRPGVGR